MSYHPLADMLSVAVPLQIAEFEAKGGPDDLDWAWLERFREVSEFANHGDDLLYLPKLKRDRGKPARMFAEVARGMAIMAFLPGGLRFNGDLYVGHHTPRETTR